MIPNDPKIGIEPDGDGQGDTPSGLSPPDQVSPVSTVHDCNTMASTAHLSQPKSSGVFSFGDLPGSDVAVANDPGLSERLDILIKRAGSQRELARVAGISEGTLTSAIARVRAGGSLGRDTTARALAKWAGVSISWVLYGEGDPPAWVIDRVAEHDDRYAFRPAALRLMRGLYPEQVVETVAALPLKDSDGQPDLDGWMMIAKSVAEIMRRHAEGDPIGRAPGHTDISKPKRR